MGIVKCNASGEMGENSEFIYIEGKHYKSQEIYDKYKISSGYRKKIHKIIIEECLNNDKSMASLVGKKLKDTKSSYEDLFNVLQDRKVYIASKINGMNNMLGKINYIFKVLESEVSVINHMDNDIVTDK